MRIRIVLPLVLLLALAFVAFPDDKEGATTFSVPIADYDLRLRIEDSDPLPQYYLEIPKWTLHYCHSPHRMDTQRMGTEIAVSVTSRLAPCSILDDDYYYKAPLGSDFEPGVTYTLHVNEATRTFTAGFEGVETSEDVAAIESVTIDVDNADPPQYFVEFEYYLPGSCGIFLEKRRVQWTGTGIEISVVNRFVEEYDDLGFSCLYWSSWERESINLGSDFEPGEVYTVRVNDWETFFRADPNAFSNPIRGLAIEPGSFVKAPQPIPEQFPPLENSERRMPVLSFVGTFVQTDDSDPPRYVLGVNFATYDDPSSLNRMDIRKSRDKLDVRLVKDFPRRGWRYDRLVSVSLSVDLGSDFEPGVTYTVYSEGQILTRFTP